MVGCSSTYAYTFHVADGKPAAPGGLETVEDADMKAEIVVDAASQAVRLDLTNKTDDVVQVEWAAIAFVRKDGRGMQLHPDVDLGWIKPGATQSARLFPLAFPRHAHAALDDDNQTFELRVPMIVRHEDKTYRYALTAHVRKQ